MSAAATLPNRPTTRRWFPRPQFSLRTFLLTVTAVGLVFPAWYRLPYEETRIPSQEVVIDPYCGQVSHKDPDYLFSRVTTTWQRQFGGPKLQHGWHRKYGAAGRLLVEQEYRTGKLHGLCRIFDPRGMLVEEGRYEHGRREGEWIEHRNENFERRGRMHQGQRHGEWVSRQSGFERRVTFHNGRVVAVEGVPVDRTFEGRFPTIVDEDGFSSRPLLDEWSWSDSAEESLTESLLNLEISSDAPIFLDESAECDSPFCEVWSYLPHSDALLILGQPHGLIPVYRYGGICLAPAKGADDWTDPTGVSDLRLPAGSKVASAWNEPVHIMVSGVPLAEALTMMVRDTSITTELDTTAITPTIGNPEGYEVNVYLRQHPFRHALAYLLYQTNCRCQLNGETLVILPPEE